MAIEMNPRPNLPKRPQLTAGVLSHLKADDVTHGNPTAAARAAKQWLSDMDWWTKWAAGYCERLDAFYVEHQAIAHDRKVESGALADGWMLGGNAPLDNCPVCQYLTMEHANNQIKEPS